MLMEKKIRSELIKMSAIMLVLVGLGIYAHEFVISGIMAKFALNMSIFVLAGLAAWLAFHHVLALKNETVALKALQVDYGSVRRRPVNPYRQPAIVFKEPELLGQGYRMITEEFSKQDEVKISNSTVQMLLHDVDQRINDRKSTIMYFSGLMVFLGLLGAFMGLMKTVHSVSDLIGGMDLSGGSGTEGMAKMIEGMKAPLNGMSVGFSSSLFGLMTSMVLGALERCMTSAMKALRNEFEHWLSNLADLEGGNSGQNEVSVKVDADFSDVKSVLEISHRQIEDVRSTVTETADHAVQTRAAMGEMAQSVTKLARSIENVYDPAPLLHPISQAVTELARNQMAMLVQFKGLYDQAEHDRAHIRAILGSMSATVDRVTSLNGGHLHRQLDNLAVLLADAGPAQSAPARRGLLSRLFGGRGNDAVGVRQDLRRMMLSQRQLTKRQGDALDVRLAQMEADRVEDRDALSHLVAQAADQQARLEVLLINSDSQDSTALPGIWDLSGARREMDVLRRRLNAREAAAEEAAQAAAADTAPTAMKGQ